MEHQYNLSEADILAALESLKQQAEFPRALRIFMDEDENFELLFWPLLAGKARKYSHHEAWTIEAASKLLAVAYPNGINGPQWVALHPKNEEFLQPRNHHQGQRYRSWPDSSIARVVNGLPNRVDRLRALGNAVDPRVAEIVIRYALDVAR